jgi:hypothetical protein
VPWQLSFRHGVLYDDLVLGRWRHGRWGGTSGRKWQRRRCRWSIGQRRRSLLHSHDTSGLRRARRLPLGILRSGYVPLRIGWLLCWFLELRERQAGQLQHAVDVWLHDSNSLLRVARVRIVVYVVVLRGLRPTRRVQPIDTSAGLGTLSRPAFAA